MLLLLWRRCRGGLSIRELERREEVSWRHDPIVGYWGGWDRWERCMRACMGTEEGTWYKESVPLVSD